MPAQKYTDDQINRSLRLRETEGLTYKQIQKITGVDFRAVGWYCVSRGIVPPNPKPRASRPKRSYMRNGVLVRPFSPSEDKLLLSLRLSGASGVTIGRRLNRAPHTVRHRLSRLAYQMELEEQSA